MESVCHPERIIAFLPSFAHGHISPWGLVGVGWGVCVGGGVRYRIHLNGVCQISTPRTINISVSGGTS